MNIGINGFGRIGRAILRCIADYENTYFKSIPQVVVNDPNMTLEYMLYLLNHDTNGFGKGKDFINPTNAGTFALSEDGTFITYDDVVNIYLTQYDDISRCEWNTYDVDVVFEATGMFTDSTRLQDHISAGAKKVILCCLPTSGDISLYVGGVTNKNDIADDIVSIASCSTQVASCLIRLLYDQLNLENCLIRLVRSYTNDQLLTDNVKSNNAWERGRAAAQNIVPTSTSAGKIIGLIIPALNGKVTGTALRTPTLLGGALEIIFITPYDVETVKSTVEEYAEAVRLAYSKEPLVSSDVIGYKGLGIVLEKSIAGLQISSEDYLVSITVLYDNEIGFAMQAVKTALELY